MYHQLASILLVCYCLIAVPSLIIEAVPFMPRFADTDSMSWPVVRQSAPGSSGFTWTVGSSDKAGYIYACQQNVTIRVAPEYLPLQANNSAIGFEFECLSGDNLTVNHTWLVNGLATNNETAQQTPACLGIARAGVELIRLNGTDFQLRSTNCGLSESRIATSPIHKLSIRVFVSQSNGSALLRSSRLTVWYLNRFAEQFEGSTDNGKRLGISKAAIKQIESAIDFDATLWRIPFLAKATLEIINGLPLYLKMRINIGLIITAADCQVLSLNESVVISTNRYASWYRTVGTSNSTTEDKLSLADLYYIDLKSGFLVTSNAKMMSEYMAVWLRLPAQLTVCEFLQFAGHSAAPYMREVSKLRIEQAAFMLPSAEATCSPASVTSTAEAPLVEVLEDSDSPAIPFSCPLVCSVARNVTCRPVSCKPPTNSSVTCTYTCSAEADSKQVTIDVKASSLTRFLLSINASLPAKVFAMEGESLSYSCSATVSASDYQRNNRSGAIRTTVHAPRLAGEKTRSRRVWTTLQPAAFSPAVTLKTSVKAGKSMAGVVETVTVTARQVPQANDGGNFTHRFTCQVAADPDKANRLYGMPAYAAEVGADIVFVPRPTDDSFRVEAINDTSFRFQLHPVFAAYLAEAGAQLRAAFRLGDRWLNASHPMVKARLLAVEFQPTSASLTLTVVPLSSSSSARRRRRRQVTGPPGERSIMAVFSFRYPDGARLGSLQKVPTNHTTRGGQLGSAECMADPRCFYTTDYDTGDASQLQQTLAINLDES